MLHAKKHMVKLTVVLAQALDYPIRKQQKLFRLEKVFLSFKSATVL